LPEPLVRWRRHANNLSHGTGSRRGPEMAVHFRKCEAMVDQMLADAGEWAIRSPGGTTPSAEVFRAFSPLRVGLYAEDDPAAFRAMLLGTCDFLPEPLVRWRRHANNLSYAGGSRRGPEMAVHFRKCEAMVDQMLADADEWVIRNAGMSAPGLEQAVSSLRFHKAKWALWAVAHEKGVRLSAFFAAAKKMAGCHPSPSVFLKEAWRPACRMVMPFPLQRVMAKLRSRS